jgi:hypothetical protein
MILTSNKIQTAIIKAYCCMASKAIKYYAGLAVGKNNACLLKEVRLLRAYIDILKSFKIVGSQTICNCCIEGDYTVLLNDLSELTEANIQFSSNNTGSMYYNDISYPFTYFYDSNNKIIVIEFSTLINPSTDEPYILNLNDVNFTDNCSFEPGTVSPIEVGVIEEVTETPVTVNNIYGNWDGNITIYEPGGGTPLNIPNNGLPIPSNILDDPEAIAVYWNDNGPTDWLLLYDGTQFTMLTPFDGTDYSTYIVKYNQYEGGSDSLINPTSFIPQNFVPTGTKASVIVDIPNTFVGSVPATSVIQPAISEQSFVTIPTQASTILEIPTDIFSNPGSKASTQFTARDDFFICTNNSNYIYDPAPNINWYFEPRAATLSFANIQECITYVNNNLSFGYELELVSTSVITYPTNVPATASTPFFNSSSYTAGDVFNIKLDSMYFNTSTPIGTYTVLPGDTNADVVAGLIASINSLGIFTGTVTTDINDFLYFTAPAGTGSDWNAVYYMYIEDTTAGFATITYFAYGNNLTENEYTLSIIAPTATSSINSNTSYVGFGFVNNINSNFSGGVDSSTTLPVEVVSAVDGTLYSILTNTFTSVDDFITAFNAASLTQATNIGVNGIYTQVEFKSPISDVNNFVYNTTLLEFSFNNIVVASNNYFGGIDITECTYTLELYDSSNVLILPVIENLTPTNYTSVSDIATDIQNNIDNTYVFGIGVNINDEITTSYPDPQSLICDTYNGYYFKLFVDYTSTQYSDYLSEDSFINGGVNAVSNEFEISDSENGVIFSRALGTYNYPNGSEVQNGLISDFNDNNTGALPLLYSAEYVSVGDDTLEINATVSNNFLTELTAEGITNGQEINAFIDNVYIGKYQAPATGVLPSYSDMITALNNSIVSTNAIPGLTSNATGSGIFQISPVTQANAYNGKLLKINKKTYTAATTTITFGNALAFTSFRLFTDSYGDIFNFETTVLPVLNTVIAAAFTSSVNSSESGMTATRVGAVVTIVGPPFTGGSFNGTPIKMDLNNTAPYNVGGITINTNVYLASGNWSNYPINSNFQGGTQSSNVLIKQAAFSGGVAPLTTTRVKFNSPTQPLIAPEYGTGNWAFNSEFFTYNYNLAEYVINNLYSGGIDPTVGQLIVEILESDLTPYATLYNDITPQNYISRQSLANIFNATNPFPDNFQISLVVGSALAQFLSPPTSFDYFNTFKFRYSYDYVSPQYTDYVDVTTTFIGGVDPVLTPYDGEFVEGDIGTFVTDNPCIPTTVEQTCLSNNQVLNIINKITKMCK